MSVLTSELAETLETQELKEAIKKKPVVPEEEPHPVYQLLKQTLDDIQKLLHDIRDGKPAIFNIPPWHDSDKLKWPDLNKWQPPTPIYCGVVEVPCQAEADPGCEVKGSVINLQDTVLQQSDSLAEHLKAIGITILPNGEVKHGNKK